MVREEEDEALVVGGGEEKGRVPVLLLVVEGIPLVVPPRLVAATAARCMVGIELVRGPFRCVVDLEVLLEVVAVDRLDAAEINVVLDAEREGLLLVFFDVEVLGVVIVEVVVERRPPDTGLDFDASAAAAATGDDSGVLLFGW